MPIANLVIIGSGPAVYMAAIYAERAQQKICAVAIDVGYTFLPTAILSCVRFVHPKWVAILRDGWQGLNL